MTGHLGRRAGRSLTVLLLAIPVLLVVSGTAKADLAQEMDGMFNSMAVATPPAVFGTAMRGVISGGGVAISNRIVNSNVVSITPPGFKAGCGGIDLFAGSFSFINAAQFEALLKSIASNATGYAFELAMNAMCPSCMTTIETLARKLQQASEKLSNSCLMAQGMVNDAASAFTGQENNKASVINMVTGAASDAFDAFSTMSGAAPINRSVTAAPAPVATQIQGNVTWRALVSQNAAGWFSYGDATLLQVLMNIGGTVIVGALGNDSVGAGSQNLNIQSIPGRPDLIDTLINGGQVSLLTCDTTDQDGCLSPQTGLATLTGFKTMLLSAFEGANGAGGGIIDKVADSIALTPSEQAVLGLLPNGLGGLVIRLASKSPDAAKSLVESAAPQVAILLANSLVQDMLRAAQASVSMSQDTRAKDVLKLIDDSWAGVRAKEIALQAEWGSLPEIVSIYEKLMGVVPPLPRALGTSVAAYGRKS